MTLTVRPAARGVTRRHALLRAAASPFALGAAGSNARATAQLAGRTMLLMVDDRACPYCRKWEREVSQGYLASPEGRALPLVRRQRGHPDLAGIGGLIYTPTFLVIVNGEEKGRVVGYAGADFFWAEIDRHVRRLGLV